MGELLKRTKDRALDIIASGYQLTVIWECEFRKQIESNHDLRRFVNGFEDQSPISPRDAFYGGRTEAIKLHHRASTKHKLKYRDINSLYPWVRSFSSIVMIFKYSTLLVNFVVL